jgi:hypothetical protein
MTNHCGNPDCDRPFGLIRFTWHFEQFCSAKCREHYKRQRERNRVYWRWLYKCPEPPAAENSREAFLTLSEREMS